MLTYEQARATAEIANLVHAEAAKVLRAFPTGPMGLTPDAVRQTQEWRAAYATERRAFEALRQANAYVVKHYGRRLRDDRQAERLAKLRRENT